MKNSSNLVSDRNKLTNRKPQLRSVALSSQLSLKFFYEAFLTLLALVLILTLITVQLVHAETPTRSNLTGRSGSTQERDDYTREREHRNPQARPMRPDHRHDAGDSLKRRREWNEKHGAKQIEETNLQSAARGDASARHKINRITTALNEKVAAGAGEREINDLIDKLRRVYLSVAEENRESR